MTGIDKRLERMRQNPRGWQGKVIEGMLARFGFASDSEGGSHRTWRHPSGVRVTIVDHGSGTVLPVYVREAVRAIDRVKEKI